MFDSRYFFPPEEIPPPKDAETHVESPIPISPSLSVGSSSPVRSTTPPPDYTFDKSIFAELDNSLWIILRPLRSEPVLEEPNEMSPKRTSTSAAPAMTQAAIRQLVADSVSAALEAQSTNMANTNNTTGPREAHVARKCSYKEFMSCQPFNFNGTEGAIGLIRWFQRTESVFSRSNCAEKNKVKFAISTLTEESLFWWNSFAQPIRIEEAYKVTWSEFKRLLIKKYCPQNEIKKMEEAITITQRLIEQVIKHNYVQKTNDHKRKLEDRRNTTNGNNNNNYRNNNHNNDYHQQHNRRQETVRTHATTSTKNKKYTKNKRVKSVISRAPIGSLKQGCHVAMKKAQGVMGFYSIITHTTSTSCHIKRMTAWQSVYVVPTGRVVVPTGRYIVLAGKVIIIVSTGRLCLVPTGRVLSPGRVK
ncbi:hypothetical protein Tco_1491654 [Tanacetum coccineum]